MKIDFLMPCRIESEDRLKNVITSVSYLAHNFPESRILVKEVDTHSTFKFRALPEIRKYVDTKNIVHIYEESDETFFHKTRILNDLLVASESEIIFNHDVDMLLPVRSYELAHRAISEGKCDAIYPFGCGVYQWAVDYPTELYGKFLDSRFNLNLLKESSKRSSSTIGWGQMIKREVEIKIGLWNENFISWGAEDCEFYYRLAVCGAKLGRIDDDIYHLEHGRTFNSHYHNPNFMENHKLWQWFRKQPLEKVAEYYSQQDYLKKRREELNVSI